MDEAYGEPDYTLVMMLESDGFTEISEHKGKRKTFTHPDAPDVVFKVSQQGDTWPNTCEHQISNGHLEYGKAFDVPDVVMNRIADVYHCEKIDGECAWIAMQKADTENPSVNDACEIFHEFKDAGWVCGDLQNSNVGYIDGKMVLIDYEHLKPIEAVGDRLKEQVENNKLANIWSMELGEVYCDGE